MTWWRRLWRWLRGKTEPPPANLLTQDAITAVTLVALHQRLNFEGALRRQFDAAGIKPGESLRIRLPEYTVHPGRTNNKPFVPR